MGDDFDIPLGVSVGAVIIPRHGRDYQTLFHYADKALYNVKINGKHGYAIHDPEVYYGKADSESPENELAHISRVIEERNTSDTAMWLGQDALKWIYRFICRMPENYTANVIQLVLILSQSKNGNIEEYGKATEQFKGILQVIRCNKIFDCIDISYAMERLKRSFVRV